MEEEKEKESYDISTILFETPLFLFPPFLYIYIILESSLSSSFSETYSVGYDVGCVSSSFSKLGLWLVWPARVLGPL